jgi:hypothetical protein
MERVSLNTNFLQTNKSYSLLVTLFILVLPFLSTAQNQMGGDIDGDAAGDQFGLRIALSADGTRVAVGAPNNDNVGTDAGLVRVLDWNGTAWVQVGGDLGGASSSAWSGSSVALSSNGNRLAIGAPGDNYARVYDWNGTSWVQVGSDILGGAAQYFGTSLAISANGNRLIVGAVNANSAAGYAKIYNWNGFSWVLSVTINGLAAGDYCGNSVAISANGNRVAVAARNHAGNGLQAGHVRMYSWNGFSWSQTGSAINGEVAQDQSGYSLAISGDGDRVAIGSRLNDGGANNAGHVRLYSWNGSSWVQTGNDIDGENTNDWSGESVALSADGDRVAIGAEGYDGFLPAAGYVRVFDWNGSAWTQTGGNINDEANSWSGSSVALSDDGNIVAVGAKFNSLNGHARVYTMNPVLSVELLEFSGVRLPTRQIKLNWTTASETNNDFFELQRLNEQNSFVTIASVLGNGTSNTTNHYSYTDETPWNGICHYRIKQIDFNGNHSISDVIQVDDDYTSSQLVVYPNPSQNGLFNISDVTNSSHVRVRNLNGILVLEQKMVDSKTLDFQHLPSGIYQLELVGLKETHYLPIVIQ